MADSGTVRFIQSAAHKIAYRRSGAGDAVVLLHPLALSGAVWGEYAERLALSFDVIAPDARGHGDSGWDGLPFGIDNLGDDVGSLLDALGLAATHVVGMSMGGSTAVSFAGRYPERVRAMMLADTSVWYGQDALRTWEERAETVLLRPRPRQVPFQVDRWFTESFQNRSASEVNRVVGHFLETSSLAHAEACRALGRMDLRSLLPSITAPTLVITGAEDYATPPAMGKAIAAGVRTGRDVTLGSLRHFSLIEDPSLADMTVGFLASGLATP